MERMEYDPEGGRYLPVTKRETGKTLIVIGVIMLISGALWALYLYSDIRSGGRLVVYIFSADVLIALVLIVWGLWKKSRQKEIDDES